MPHLGSLQSSKQAIQVLSISDDATAPRWEFVGDASRLSLALILLWSRQRELDASVVDRPTKRPEELDMAFDMRTSESLNSARSLSESNVPATARSSGFWSQMRSFKVAAQTVRMHRKKKT